MVAYSEPGQRIVRLTPLADALAMIETSVHPVEARNVALASAVGRTLAADVIAPAPQPAAALALHDGWAVRSEETTDASSYAPAALTAVPLWLDTGETLPVGADAVAPPEAVMVQGKQAVAMAVVRPGEGVLPVGGDVQAGKLRSAGERLRALDGAVLAAAGVSRVTIREPRICLARARDGVAIAASYGWLRDAIGRDDAAVVGAAPENVVANNLEAVLDQKDSDAVIVLGGTGMGSSDRSVDMLARKGRVGFHGVGLIPGETAAFGMVGSRPVLMIPGRLDAAVAVWLVLGRRLLARLTACREEEMPAMAALTRKVTSTLGMTEVVPVRCDGGKAEPLAAGYLSFSALTRANGWILVPAESEGYSVGASVAVRPLA